ncbi:hypothetical protein QEJ31_05960 [Pigmentibacter sp. JX0631]|uniref:hypothetical protein n=1 Tax=Pigmentibacter sp. JX0631 TaxID=2976982 RepID=UPI0024685264|nr:hypothetical protein [Pigmentibacter sp. JX0631]WGL61140.1 hypothetical protein QEJ31_05960 [Pigmentibacter sp. JX0631]
MLNLKECYKYLVVTLLLTNFLQAKAEEVFIEPHEVEPQSIIASIRILDDSTFNLTKDQKQKMKKIFDDQIVLLKAISDELHGKLAKINTAILDETKSDTDLKKMYLEYLDLKKRILELHFQNIIKIRKLLNNTQKKYLLEHLEGHKDMKAKYE